MSLSGTTLGICCALVAPQDPMPIQQKVKAMTAAIRPEALRQTIVDLEAMGSRHTGGPGKEKALAYLEAQVRPLVERSNGRLRMQREEHEILATRLGKTIPIVNLIVTLPGTSDPERIYVLGGHFDSINGDVKDAEGKAPGANDDGSGTAAVLEALRAMCGGELAATVEFCFFDAEEMGLLGSTAHAEALAKRGAAIDGMITNDIVGNTLGPDGKKHDKHLRCFWYAARGNDSPGRSFARAATYAQRTHVPDLELRMVLRGDRYFRGGDHRPFENQGWPALRFTEAAEDYARQHQNVRESDGKRFGDTSEFVDFGYLAKVAAIDVATLAEVASAPRPPTRVQVERPRVTTECRFAVTAPEGTALEAVWRETTAVDWQQAAALPAPGAHVLALCIDDHVLGVRSVGKDGSRSRAIAPPEPDAVDQRAASRPGSRRGR